MTVDFELTFEILTRTGIRTGIRTGNGRMCLSYRGPVTFRRHARETALENRPWDTKRRLRSGML